MDKLIIFAIAVLLMVVDWILFDKYSSSENIEHCIMIDDERCLISED